MIDIFNKNFESSQKNESTHLNKSDKISEAENNNNASSPKKPKNPQIIPSPVDRKYRKNSDISNSNFNNAIKVEENCYDFVKIETTQKLQNCPISNLFCQTFISAAQNNNISLSQVKPNSVQSILPPNPSTIEPQINPTKSDKLFANAANLAIPQPIQNSQKESK